MATHVARRATRARRPAVTAGDPVLPSNITAPGAPEWAVRRPRITKLIAEGTRWCPLTVVTGPPGAGKTMALALWAAEQTTVAWVSADDHHNRPGVFWSYAVTALRRSGVAIPRAVSAAARGRAADHAFLLRLASALAAQDPPVTLVVDDFHLITGPKVANGLDFVLRNVGSGLRLVVASRMDPLLPLYRYRLAGGLTEIRASDLAFSAAEARLLMAQHGITLSAGSLDCLTRRTEGWAAGIRLAAISMGNHPHPDQFVEELIAEDSALTGYLVDEVLNAQPRRARDVLLRTSILEHVSAEAACELAGHKQAAGVLPALARANAFVQPTGRGWYRYHPLFAEVLRLKLRREYPDRVAPLHRRAALWYARNGTLTDAVRHAAQAGDWQLAASIVIDGLAISEILEPWGSQPLAGEFRGMPRGRSWTEPEPYLVCAAIALSGGREEPGTAALGAAEAILERLPAGQKPACRLAAAMIHLAAARRTGRLPAAVAAIADAEALVSRVPADGRAPHPRIRARVLSGRGAVELWSGHLDQAARVLDSGVAAATPDGDCEGADCLGHLALVEALRGRPCRAARLAARAAADGADGAGGKQRPSARHPSPAALVALAWVHLERNELRDAHGRLKQVDAALSTSPDKLIGTVAWLTVACIGLAEGRPRPAVGALAKARAGWSAPAWLEQRLSLVESRAHRAAGDISAALAAAERSCRDNPLEAAAMLAHARVAAGDGINARRALEPALAAHNGAPDRVRLEAWLADARLRYGSGDSVRGRQSLASALQLAGPQRLRLPFVMERRWIGPLLRCDPELADAHRRLLAPTPRAKQPPALPGAPDQATVPVLEPLTDREREVLRHVSVMLNTAEIASEMFISINTVKSHLKSIHRKLGASHRFEAVRRAKQLELI